MESKFTGKVWGRIWRSVVFSLLSAVTLGIATPWVTCMWQRWYKKHTYVNGLQLSFDGTGWQLLGNSLLWSLLTFITLGIYGMWVPVQYHNWIAKHTHFAQK